MSDEMTWGETQQARVDAEEQAEAERHGVSLEDLRSAKQFGMDPLEFVSFNGVHDVNAAQRLDDELKELASAKQEAARLERVEAERKKL